MGEEKRKIKQYERAPMFRYHRASELISASRADKKIAPRFDHTGLRSFLKLKNLPTILAIMLVVGVLLLNGFVERSASYKFTGLSGTLKPEGFYVKAIDDILSSSLFYRSKLTLSSEDLEEKITKTYPEIAFATVSIPLVGSKPIIGIAFSRPTLLVETSSGKLLVGDDGRTLSSAEGDVSVLPNVHDFSGIDYKPGQRFLLPTEVEFLKTLFDEIKSNDLQLQSIDIGKSPQDVRVQIYGDSYQVKFNFGHSVREQLGAMWVVKQRLKDENIIPTQYIDVRLGERAYIK